MKKLFLVAVGLTLSLTTFAQLTQRENNPSNYKIGTRPLEGDWAFFLGIDPKSFQNILNEASQNDKDLLETRQFNLMNIKYYKTNNLVYRGGIAAYREKVVKSGEIYTNIGLTNSDKFKSKSSIREYILMPGIERHFNSTNFFDVYVGASVLVGARFVSVDDIRGKNSTKVRGNNFVYGAETFFGLQWFVADLPISIGFEYGLTGTGSLAKRYKVTTDDGNTSQKYFVESSDNISNVDNLINDVTNAGNKHSKLKQREFQLNNNIRFTLSYYFNK